MVAGFISGKEAFNLSKTSLPSFLDEAILSASSQILAEIVPFFGLFMTWGCSFF
jgi:hypothetical protein